MALLRMPTAGEAHRPGHADLAGVMKYGLSDVRDVLERASARETAARVAGGALCRAFLRELGVEIVSHVLQIGSVRAPAYPEPLEPFLKFRAPIADQRARAPADVHPGAGSLSAGHRRIDSSSRWRCCG